MATVVASVRERFRAVARGTGWTSPYDADARFRSKPGMNWMRRARHRGLTKTALQ